MKHVYRLVGSILVVILIAFAYQRVFGSETVSPHLVPSQATAMIGSGDSAVAVGADGAILTGLPTPEEGSLPELPLETPPKDGRLHGPVLEQAKVLGAAPAALRPYLEGSYFGESGVDVELISGIELRFGDARQVARKWRAATAVLADPAVTTLDYVDLHAPSHPSTGGSGHTLPPLP